MEKKLEFGSIKEFSTNKEVNDANLDTISMHYDKSRKKYLTTITYGKKQKTG